MSVRASNWAWRIAEDLELADGEFRVLARLADHADSDGLCWPGMVGLAKACVKSERRVRDNIARLEARGLLHRERREKKGRGRLTDHIHLHIDDQPDTPSGDDQPDVADGPTGRFSQDQPDVDGTRSIQGNRQKEPSGETSGTRPEVERLCQLMADLSNERTDPDGNRSSPKYVVTKAWRDEMRRLFDIDGQSEQMIEGAIRWVHGHSFWSSNVLSVPKLREQFDKLVLQAKREREGKGGGSKADRVQSNIETLRRGAQQ